MSLSVENPDRGMATPLRHLQCYLRPCEGTYRTSRFVPHTGPAYLGYGITAWSEQSCGNTRSPVRERLFAHFHGTRRMPPTRPRPPVAGTPPKPPTFPEAGCSMNIAEEQALLTRYMYDAEFHAAVHTYAIRARGSTSWTDDDGVLRQGPTLADAKAVVALEMAGVPLLIDLGSGPVNPIKLCCGRPTSEHNGSVCPDGKFMCCICFERFPFSEASGDPKTDVCRRCEPLARRPTLAR